MDDEVSGPAKEHAFLDGLSASCVTLCCTKKGKVRLLPEP